MKLSAKTIKPKEQAHKVTLKKKSIEGGDKHANKSIHLPIM